MVVAIQTKQPITAGMRLQRIGPRSALQRGRVLRQVIAHRKAIGGDLVGHVILEQPPEEPRLLRDNAADVAGDADAALRIADVQVPRAVIGEIEVFH
ncbi:hypothetical protein D9M73_214030 [compost metagenome]